MLDHWESHLTIPLEQRVFASDPRANRLVKENLSAFLMAAAIDRGGQAFELWNLPYKLQESWGHLDTTLIKDMDPARLKDEESIARAPSQIARLHLARTIAGFAGSSPVSGLRLAGRRPRTGFAGPVRLPGVEACFRLPRVITW